MDRIETPPAPGEALAPRGSQSRLSAGIFFVLLAALLFRVVTVATHRESAHGRESSTAAPPLVSWTPLEKAGAASTASGKPVLYDFTAEWCGPCHRLDREGWGDRELAAFASEAFVPARVLDREREEGKNPPLVAQLQQKFAVQAFPTLVVASADGTEIGRFEGWDSRERLRAFLEETKAKGKSKGAGPASP